MTSSVTTIEKIELASGRFDVYKECCGTIYITLQGLLIFHCSHCPARYSQLRQYLAHMQLKHYCTVSIKDWPTKNVDDDDGDDGYEIVFGPTATLQPEDTKATDHVALATTEIVLLPEAEQEEQYEDFGSGFALENVEIWQAEQSANKLECMNLTEEHEQEQKHKELLDSSLFEVETMPDALSQEYQENDIVNAHKLSSNAENSLELQNTKLIDCNKCAKKFATRKAWTVHQITHVSFRKHLCSRCGATFKEACALHHHMALHDPQALKHACKVCGKLFSSKHTLNTHQRQHTGERPFACNICDYTTTTNELLKTHMRVRHENKHFNCEICQKAIYTRCGLKKHMRHHEIKQDKCTSQLTVKPATSNPAVSVAEVLEQLPEIFKCEKCDKVCDSKKHLHNHMQVHAERRFKCSVCGLAFRDKGNCKVHTRRHGSEKKYSCTDCPKQFYTSTELVLHKRVHTGEKPYICPTCGLTFRKSGALTTHIKYVHEKERKFKCGQCVKSFKESTALKLHQQVHDRSLRKYVCDICYMRFARNHQLRDHMKMHENAREFKCNYCEAAYNQKTVLIAHIKSKHGF